MKRINTFYMRTGVLAAILVVFTIGLSSAQTDNNYTLQQCIDYALKNSTTVKAADFDSYIAEAQIAEVRGAGLPQINAGVTIMDNPKLQRMFQNFDPGQPGFASFFFDPANLPPAGVYAFPNMFQLRSSGDAKVSATQLLFSGSYLVGLQASRTYAELSVKNANVTKTQVVENVTKAFYSVLINQERKALIDANIASLDSSLTQTRAMNKQGFVEKIDVDRLEVTYNNLLAEKNKFDMVTEMTLYLLKYQMGYDSNTPLTPVGEVRTLSSQLATIPTADTTAYLKRPEYSLLKTQYKLENLNLKNKRAYYLPTLSAFGNYGYFRGADGLGGLFEKRAQPVQAFGTNVSGTWFNYYNYGVSLNVPIFSGFTQRAKIQQSKIALQKIQNNVEALKQGSAFQAKQSEISMRSNLATVTNQERNLKLAEEVRRVSKLKYQQGVGSNLEVVTAETSYKEAQTNYYNAVYDLLVSGLDYQKATGTLYQTK